MDKHTFKHNLLRYYELATPEQISEGLEWYARAARFARSIARKHKVNFDTTCRVVAVISPRLAWEFNVKAATAILDAYARGERSVTTRALPANIDKAWRILDGETDAIQGPKVTAFYHNIRYSDSDMVTIDKHAWRACIADPDEPYYTQVPAKHLEDARRAYTEAAFELGMRPCEFQAIIWLVVKSLRPEWKGG